MTSSRSTPGFDPRCKRHMSLRLFILAQTMCFSAGFPLSPPQKPLCVERKRKRAGHDGKGKQREEAFTRLFPLSIVPWALSIFLLLLFLLGYPSGISAEERVFPSSQKPTLPNSNSISGS